MLGASALEEFAMAADIRQVTDRFSVAPQIDPEDVQAAKAQGFVKLINNRPDGEVPGQPTSAEMQAAAKAAGLSYVHIPFAGRPSAAEAEAVAREAEAADGPVLAFCRSGTRSITAWSIGQALAGRRTPRDLVQLAAGAGYDLSPIFGG
jgi:uncharacterized protein (TIGR01244 family)